MDLVKAENVNVSKSVIIKGETQTNLVEELEEELVTYGSIKRHLVIDDPCSKFHNHVIIEYNEISAMRALKPQLPLDYKSPRDPNVTFTIRALDSVYTLEEGDSATKCYLEVLQNIAEASGKSFQDMLQEELSKMGMLGSKNLPTQEVPAAEPDKDSQSQTSDIAPSPSIQQEVVTATTTTHSLHASPVWSPEHMEPQNPAKRTEPTVTQHSLGSAGAAAPVMVQQALAMSDVNPPRVQQMVIEHIVKNDNAMSHQRLSFRLRVFSGKIPRPSNEPDYFTWRTGVEFLMTDPSISDLHRTQKILDSLLPPATDVIKQVTPQASPSAYLELLDSVYGSVEDGDDLFFKFMSTLQDGSEKPSEYLHRLQVILSTAIRRGGVSEKERNHRLLKQFCYGCWDQDLITDLQLEHKKEPPSFTELVFLIRTEEGRHASKQDRMRKHLGLQKQVPGASKLRTVAHRQTIYPCEGSDASDAETDILRRQIADLQTQVSAMQTPTEQKIKTHHPEAAEINALRKQVTEMKAQVALMKPVVPEITVDGSEVEITALKTQMAELQTQMTRMKVQDQQTGRKTRSKEPVTKAGSRPTDQRTAEQRQSNRPRPWYCFRCGEDGHIMPSCENEPNPELVEQKRHLCKERQLEWDRLNH